MKIPLRLITLLAVVAAGSWLCWPALKCAAQSRRQGAEKKTTGAGAESRILQITGAESRIALVIGNGAYEEVPLANPVNDARDMATALRQLGFDVLVGENRNRRQMEDLIREFGQKIRGGGVGMFYFAGHGVQVGGANYLIPIGYVINSEAEVKYEAVDAGFVLAQMEAARNRMNIMVLDACRNNPFARSFRSMSNGLASIDAPVGTLIAYATAPGRTASDGKGRNGLYTQKLLAAMRVPGLKIEDVFKQVRSEVRRQSNNQQIPWEASSIEGDFYFSTTGVEPEPAAPAPAPAAPAPTSAPNAGNVQEAMSEMSIGLSHYIKKEYDEALRHFDRAVRLAPDLAAAYLRRGAVYSAITDYDQALVDINKSISLDPEQWESYLARAALYGLRREYNRVIVDCTKTIQLNPNIAQAYTIRAIAYREIGRKNLAEADERTARRLGK
jgi:tetratricopeptide (TPR) repeat protein